MTPIETAIACDGHEADVKKSDASLTCRVETDFARVRDLRPAWDAAVRELGGSLYMTFDWLRVWWEFYGVGKRLRLFLFEQGDRIVAILPLCLETFWWGPLKTVVARLVGANIPPKAFNPPVDTAVAGEVFARLIRHLFVEDRCDLLSFGGVTKTWAPQAHFQPACEAAGDLVSEVVYEPRDVLTVFRLPATFDEYMASLSSSERKNRRKRLRALEKAYEIGSQIISRPEDAESELESFLVQHTAQWQSEGRGGHFHAWPRGVEFHRELVRAHAPRDRLRFFRLLANGQVVVNRYTYLFGDTLYSELPSRVVGAEWDRLGIGSSSMVKFIESAIHEKIRFIDSGLGSYEHKVQLGGEEIPIGVWRVAGGRHASRIKARLFLWVSRFIGLVFHKLWYRRILPRLPKGVGRTQAMFWLRYEA